LFSQKRRSKFFSSKKDGKMAEWLLRQFGRLVPLKDCWFDPNFFRKKKKGKSSFSKKIEAKRE
jgi:hypothetical protein